MDVDLTTIKEPLVSKTLILKPNESSAAIKVNIKYQDIFTGKLITNQVEAKCVLKKMNGSAIGGSFEVSKSGFAILFGGLSANTDYELNASYSNISAMADYSSSKSFKVEGISFQIIDIDLNWTKTPTVILTLLDKTNAPVEGAQIFTYTNYDFLKLYKDNADASIREGVTNAKGEVIFTNLNNGKYYFYGVKTIGTDKYNTLDPAYDPTKATALITDINRSTIKLQ